MNTVSGQEKDPGDLMWWAEIPKPLRWVTHLTALGFVIILCVYLVWDMTGARRAREEQMEMNVAKILDLFDQHVANDNAEVQLLRIVCALDARQAKDSATERGCWAIR